MLFILNYLLNIKSMYRALSAQYFYHAYFVWPSFFELVHTVFILVPSHLSHFIILSTNFRDCTSMYTKLPPKIPFHHIVQGGRLVASWGHSKPFKQKMRKFTPSGTPFIITRALRYRSDCQFCAKSDGNLTSLIRITYYEKSSWADSKLSSSSVAILVLDCCTGPLSPDQFQLCWVAYVKISFFANDLFNCLLYVNSINCY